MKSGRSGGNLVDLGRLTQQQAALICGVTARAFRDWNCPRNADGTYDAATVVKFYATKSGPSSELDLNEERARLAKWQADKMHQDVELRAGKMLLEDDVQQWVAGMIATARQRLVQIPENVRQVVPPDVAERVASENRRLIHEALAELAAHRRGGPRADVDALGTPADADGERVGGPVPKAKQRKQRRARPVED